MSSAESEPDDQQHKYDVLDPGDKIPWAEGYAEITDREVTDAVPDDVPDWGHPDEFDPPERDDLDVRYVILTIERPDGETGRLTACRVAHELRESFDKHGLPSVRCRPLGTQGSRKTKVQTPATGGNPLDPEQATALAAFLRDHAEFDPLYALLGGVESAEDMNRVADALDRAVTAVEITDRVD